MRMPDVPFVAGRLLAFLSLVPHPSTTLLFFLVLCFHFLLCCAFGNAFLIVHFASV